MENKSAIWIFTLLLGLACLYSISLSVVSSSFKAKAKSAVEDSLAEANIQVKDMGKEVDSYLRAHAKDEAYPILGKSYEEVLQDELNLGLDLRGGMSVILEVSVADLVLNLADKTQDKQFRAAVSEATLAQQNTQDDYMTLFEEAWKNQGTDKQLWRFFTEAGDQFKPKATDDEVFEQLRKEAQQAMANTENIIRKRIDRFGVAQPNVQRQSFSDRILVELPGVKDKARVTKQLRSTANLEFHKALSLNEVGAALVQANEKVSREKFPDAWVKLDEIKAKNEARAKMTPEELKADSAATDSTDLDIDPLLQEKQAYFFGFSDKALLIPEFLQQNQTSPVIGYASENDTSTVNTLLKSPMVKAELPENTVMMWGAKADARGKFPIYAFNIDGDAELTGKNITDAQQGYDELNNVTVNMDMDSEGSAIWASMTEKNINQYIAVTMDNTVYSAPIINEKISGGSSRITMGSQGSNEQRVREAEDLSSLLKAGSLPAPAKIIQSYEIGSTVGAANIKNGLISFAIALAVILLYMIFYYRGAGVVADIALLINLFFLLGALISVGAALTLPGIAGLVLTIGMSVDANVLIFERIKEEMRVDSSLRSALTKGYEKAYSAILDANITTMLTALVLIIFGSGPIRGFAVILIIGIFTSLYTAILITRLIFFYRLDKKKSISFSSPATEKWFTNTKTQFVGKRKAFYGISGILVAACLVGVFTTGLNYGVEFKGGRTYTVAFDQDLDMQALRSSVTDAIRKDDKLAEVTVKEIGTSGREAMIATAYLIDSEDENADEKVFAAVKDGIAPFGNYDEANIEKNKVDPSISDDFRRGALLATIFSLIVIFLYILIRFRKWQFGLGALIAMAHDVIIVLGIFALCKNFMPFTMQIDQAFIAAILTVIGYSINDTVVVFDRIREYLGSRRKGDKKAIVNDALNSTLSRTINTSLSTFVVLLTIFIFAGDNIRGFIFALMIGVVVGTYSSIFIATPSVIDFKGLESDTDSAL